MICSLVEINNLATILWTTVTFLGFFIKHIIKTKKVSQVEVLSFSALEHPSKGKRSIPDTAPSGVVSKFAESFFMDLE